MVLRLDPDRHRGVIFDLDGVITDTASVHGAAWARLFDAFLADRPPHEGEDHRSFSEDDYRTYVDGKARTDGVESFLRSRGIDLPHGSAEDPPDAETAWGLGNRKNGYFLEVLERDGATVFPDTVELVESLHEAHIATAVISASRNCREVLERAGIDQLFEARVDGVVAADLGLPGKPDPAVFLEAARRIAVAPGDAVVVEDALAGVEAGRRGRFGLVIGIDRVGGRGPGLIRAGADHVVAAFDEVRVDGRPRPT